jgi:hypothetical protein
VSTTANAHLLNEAVAHQVDLQRYSTGVVRRVIALLNRTDADLVAQAGIALREARSAFTAERLELLLAQVRTINAAAYVAIERELTAELQGLVDVEAKAQLRLFEAAIPAQAAITLAPTIVPGQVAAAALAQPFRGRLLREWMSHVEVGRMARVRDIVRLGVVEGETIGTITKRLRDALPIDRRNAEAVVRTAVSHVAGFTRDAVYKTQADIVASILWVSTLDARTTDLCRIRDRLRYAQNEAGRYRPLGHKVPWLSGPGRLHWQCRSSSAPVLKSWKELGLTDPSPSVRASMDGEVPAELRYGDWLKRQSAARQDEIVGPTRGRLMREGRLPFDALYTERGAPLTLDQLRERRPEAFTRAGL